MTIIKPKQHKPCLFSLCNGFYLTINSTIKMIRCFFFLCYFIYSTLGFSQDLNTYQLDKDSLFGVVILQCSTQYEDGRINYENMDRSDSLRCLKISHYYLENSTYVLSVGRNYYGDTLSIGLKNGKSIKERWSFFRRPYFHTKIKTLFGEKVGEWRYFTPQGELKEVISY